MSSAPRSALEEVDAIAARHGLRREFPPAVLDEVAALVDAPGIDDDTLTDLTDRPFITIDNEDSRDLDQAMYIERAGDGHRVQYALADASYFVRPGTALFDEALLRAASYYLPGRVIPMLPAALCEGVVSLNEQVPRRALVFTMTLDARGEATATDLVRARVRSRRKLTYDGVQRYHDALRADAAAGDPHDGHAFSETLRLLREVGEARLARAAERNVVRYQRRPVKVAYRGGEQHTFALLSDERNDVERWNEQVSLLCNGEGARFLSEHERTRPGVQAIFRAHPPPEPGHLEELRAALVELARLHDLGDEWCWSEDESLSEYLRRLPGDDGHARLVQAIHRQALVINRAASFQDRPGPHHGAGADPYARFSSPMREIVGVFTHHEAVEVLEGSPARAPTPPEEELHRRVIAAGNSVKQLSRRLVKDANKLAIDALFHPDLAHPLADRPARAGTLLGVRGSRLYVQLDDPPIEVKVYLDALLHARGDRLARTRSELVAATTRGLRFVVGERVDVRVTDYDVAAGRWRLEAVSGGRC